MLTLLLLCLCLNQDRSVNLDEATRRLAAATGPDRIPPLLELVEGLAGEDEPRALQYAEEARDLLRLYPNREAYIKLLQDKCFIHARLGEYDQAEAMVDEQLDMSKITKDQFYGQALRDKGVVHLYRGDYLPAIDYLNRAMAFLPPDSEDAALVYGNLGVVYRRLGEHHDALEYYLKALSIHEKLDEKINQALILNNIGTIYRHLERYPEALTYYRRALKLKEQYASLITQAVSLSNIGLTYHQLKDYETSLEYHQRALELRLEAGNPKEASTSLLNLARVNVDLGRLEEAERLTQRCIEIQRRQSPPDDQLETQIFLAEILSEQGKPEQAMTVLTQAADLLADNINKRRTYDYYKTLSAVRAGLGDYQGAYQAHLVFSELDNQLYNEETTKAVTQIERRYELGQRQQRIDELQRENQIAALDLSRQQTLRWATALGMTGLFLVIFLTYSRIMARRKLARERQVNEQLRRLDRLKDEFLANTSHELKTPLNGIIGLAESLYDGAAGPVSGQVKGNLAMIANSGKRLAALVSDLLDFSKMTHDELHLSPRAVDVFALTDVVLALSKPLLGQKNLTLGNHVPKDLPRAHADENRLLQILHNLVGNAVKYTLEGRITVSAQLAEDHLQITVSDTGVGIPADHQDSIFNSFEQVDGTLTRAVGGAGLGLAVTRALVHQHGGRIWVDSIPGEGSQFHFTLPVDQGVTAPLDLEHRPAEPPSSILTQARPQPISSQVSTADTFRILIVDDDPINRQVLFNHLSLKSYTLAEAESGDAVLSLMAQGKTFDLMLLDVMMPRMSGYELCRRIRQDHPLTELPIIFLTARAGVDDLVTGFEAGGNDFLTKPVTKGELLTRLRLHLSLLHTNRHLEDLVSERTLDLEHANLQLRRAQQRLMTSAHRAGMAEIAVNVLHNVGNSLNSINASSQVLLDAVREPKSMRMLEQLVTMLKGKREDLETFLLNDQKGRLVPEALGRIYDHQLKILDKLSREVQQIQNGIDQIRDVVDSQQQFAEAESLMEPLDLAPLFKEILALEARVLKDHQIQVHLKTPETPLTVLQDRFKLTGVFAHLITNAVQALAETQHERHLTLLLEQRGPSAQILISDNGPGIPPGLRERIFAQGVTTREHARGFGLHYCANAMTQMKGTIHLMDVPEGACFQLTLPLSDKQTKNAEAKKGADGSC